MRSVGLAVVCLAVVGMVVVVWPREHKAAHTVEPRVKAAPDVVAYVRPALSLPTETVRVPAWLAGSGRPRHIAGHVLVEGVPLPGASVRLASRAAEIVGAPVLQATSDAEGAFDFGMQPGTGYTLAAVDDGRTQALVHFEAENPGFATDALEVELPPCVVFSGSVRDKGMVPVARARIAAATRAAFPVETDGEGLFTVCFAGQENPLVVVSAPGFARTATRLNQNIVLDPAEPLVGLVVGKEDKKPIADAAVFMHSSYYAIAWTLTNSSGQFRFDDFGPSVELTAMTDEGLASGYKPKGNAKLEVERMATLEATVEMDEKPVAGVAISQDWLPPWMWTRYSHEDGSIRVPYFYPGNPYTRLHAADPYSLISPEIVDFTQPIAGLVIQVGAFGTIRGTVRRDGRPVAGVTVTCAGSHKVREKPIKSEADGSYVCDGLRAGSFRVSAELEASGDATEEVNVEVGWGQIRTVNIDRWYNASVSGVLVTTTGKPVPGARVALRSAEREDDAFTETDVAGKFRVDQLVGGTTYDVFVARFGGVIGGAPVTRVAVSGPFSSVDGLRVTIESLPPTIAGRVLDAAGAGVAGAQVSRYLISNGNREDAETDHDGRFVLYGPPGERSFVDVTDRSGRSAKILLADGATELTATLISKYGIDGYFYGLENCNLTFVDVKPWSPPIVENNQFWVRGLQPGRVHVVFACKGKTVTRDVDVVDGIARPRFNLAQ